MSNYDLRLVFPLSGEEFVVGDHDSYICRLSEVSDLRPKVDRLSWYLVFDNNKARGNEFRKLEVVTPAASILQNGWPADLRQRIDQWLASNERDGRVEWMEASQMKYAAAGL